MQRTKVGLAIYKDNTSNTSSKRVKSNTLGNPQGYTLALSVVLGADVGDQAVVRNCRKGLKGELWDTMLTEGVFGDDIAK